ncbi:MAG: hypothetical protein KF830_12115 [Planctomycetes bacterium]|nr:hypothetical protein [Planctomycetota bacterium]
MSNFRFATLLLSAAAAAALAPAGIAQITPGNLLVLRVGTGSAALTNASTAVFLDEFTTTGAFVQTIALPTAPSGGNLPLTTSGSATSEGFLTQSVDGNHFVAVGYGAAPGIANIVGTASATTPRVVGRVALDGTVDTSTSIDNAFSANNIRSGCTEDGSQFWTVGANSGVVLVPFGGTSGTSLNAAAPTNCRVVGIDRGQLYTTSGSGATQRCVNTVGTGVPTVPGQTPTILPGMSSGTASPYDFWFADPSTVYVADDRSVATGGGIQKWVESGGTWTLAYTLASGTSYRGLSGIVSETGTTLFATAAVASANQLVSVVDVGPTSTFNVLAAAPTNTAFRGVRFVRTPYGVSFGGTSCPTSVGVPTIGFSGAPVSGNADFAVTVGNAPDIVGPGVGITFWATAVGIGSPLFPFGVQIPDAPTGCALLFAFPDLLLTGLTDFSGSANIPLALAPADTSLWGLTLSIQNAVFDFTGFYGSFGLPVGTSVGMQLTLGN